MPKIPIPRTACASTHPPLRYPHPGPTDCKEPDAREEERAIQGVEDYQPMNPPNYQEEIHASNPLFGPCFLRSSEGIYTQVRAPCSHIESCQGSCSCALSPFYLPRSAIIALIARVSCFCTYCCSARQQKRAEAALVQRPGYALLYSLLQAPKNTDYTVETVGTV